MSELETWMTEDERKQIVVSKVVGKYGYTFVFDGESYKRIKKVKI